MGVVRSGQAVEGGMATGETRGETGGGLKGGFGLKTQDNDILHSCPLSTRDLAPSIPDSI